MGSSTSGCLCSGGRREPGGQKIGWSSMLYSFAPEAASAAAKAA